MAKKKKVKIYSNYELTKKIDEIKYDINSIDEKVHKLESDNIDINSDVIALNKGLYRLEKISKHILKKSRAEILIELCLMALIGSLLLLLIKFLWGW